MKSREDKHSTRKLLHRHPPPKALAILPVLDCAWRWCVIADRFATNAAFWVTSWLLPDLCTNHLPYVKHKEREKIELQLSLRSFPKPCLGQDLCLVEKGGE